MTKDEALKDPRYLPLAQAYERSGYSGKEASWYARRELETGQPCVFRSWTDEEGQKWAREGAGEPHRVGEEGIVHRDMKPENVLPGQGEMFS